METKPTNLPWRISGSGKEVYADHPDGFTTPFIIADGSGKDLFGPLETEHHLLTAQTNAAFIVRACPVKPSGSPGPPLNKVCTSEYLILE